MQHDDPPHTFIPEGEALDSGNGFAQLQPSLVADWRVYSFFHQRLERGRKHGFLHRIGYDGQSRSHFDSQHFWQNGIPGDADTEEGFMYRRINAAYDLNHPDNAFVAAGLSSNQLVALKEKT